MAKKISLFILSAFLFSAPAFADCAENCVNAAGCAVPVGNEIYTCRDVQFKCRTECGEKPPQIEYQDDDVLFTGTKLQSGNTTIMQGDRIPVDPSGLGHLRPEDLAYFEKNVAVSTTGGRSVTTSESKNEHGWLSGSSEDKSRTVTLQPGLSVSEHKKNK